MKRFLVLTLAAFLLCVGCSERTGNDLPENGFENSGNWYLEWFVVTPETLIEIINPKLAEAGYPKLFSVRDDGEFIEFNDTSEMQLYTKPISLVIHKEDRNIRILDSEFDIKDEATAKKAGFYFSMLINMFSPRDAEKIIEALHIFDEFEEGVAFYEYESGNVIYSFAGRQLSIRPIEYDETIVPIDTDESDQSTSSSPWPVLEDDTDFSLAGYTLSIPSGWFYDESRRDSGALYFAPPVGDGALSFTAERHVDFDSLSDISSFLDYYTNGFEQIHDVSLNPIDMDAGSGICYKFSDIFNGVEYTSTIYAIENGNDGTIVLAVSFPSDASSENIASYSDVLSANGFSAD